MRLFLRRFHWCASFRFLLSFFLIPFIYILSQWNIFFHTSVRIGILLVVSLSVSFPLNESSFLAFICTLAFTSLSTFIRFSIGLRLQRHRHYFILSLCPCRVYFSAVCATPSRSQSAISCNQQYTYWKEYKLRSFFPTRTNLRYHTYNTSLSRTKVHSIVSVSATLNYSVILGAECCWTDAFFIFFLLDSHSYPFLSSLQGCFFLLAKFAKALTPSTLPLLLTLFWIWIVRLFPCDVPYFLLY